MQQTKNKKNLQATFRDDFLAPPCSTKIKDFQNWLDSFLNFEKLPQKNIFWLDKVQHLCAILGNPQDYVPCVHIAGSKGKGSISCMVANIIQEHTGSSCGLYTSPHIIDFLERIKTAQGFLTKDIYEKSIFQLKQAVLQYQQDKTKKDRPLTWFELVTVFSFLCFKNASLPYCVYEVGLGGRLDATNVIRPRVCAISQIEREHTEFLGDTISKIALQKAGIIKQNTPVVVYGRQTKQALKVFYDVAKKNNAPLLDTRDYFSKTKSKYIIKNGVVLQNVTFYCNMTHTCDANNLSGNANNADKANDILKQKIQCNMQLLGDFQKENAKVAILVAKTLFPDIKAASIERGLEKSVLSARFEQLTLQNGTQMVLDGAHTINSIASLVATYKKVAKIKKQTKKPVVLFSCAADKDTEHIAPLFYDFAQVVILTTLKTKHTNFSDLCVAFQKANVPFIKQEDFNFAMQNALDIAKTKDTGLLVTGSFYLVAQAKNYI